MREIKFRAWDKEEKEMLELVTVGCTRKDSWGSLYIKDKIINGFDHRNYDTMQYTGLKDKNGVEIYESDIVVNYVGDVWIITYFRGAFRYYPIESFSKEKEKWFETDNIGNFVTEAFEVIGNIYENPDLLEVAE